MPSPFLRPSPSQQTSSLESRQLKRALALVFLFAVSGFLIVLGFQGYVTSRSGVPAHYLGFFFAGVGVLGLGGVNVWRGGPLDMRNDPPPDRGGW